MTTVATEVVYGLTDVSRLYERGSLSVAALRGVTMSVAAGESVAVLGPSGSGKSTLLQLLGAMDRPSSGVVSLLGRSLSDLSDSELTDVRRRSIGFVFQQFNLIPTLTALENVAVAMGGTGVARGAARSIAGGLLERVGLSSRADHLPSRLSGGEQQRVAIARALANSPAVLLADEPTGNLDAETAGSVISLLLALRATDGLTVVVVTHDPEIAARMARRVTLRDGAVIADSGPQPG